MDEQEKLPEGSNNSDGKAENTQNNNHLEPNEPLHHKHAKLVLVTLSLFLLVVIGVLSYALTQNSEEMENSSDTSNSQQPTIIEQIKEAETVEASPPDNWLEFTSTEYKVKLPDGWSFKHQDNGVLIYDCDSMIDGCYEVIDGTRATVEEVVGGRGGLQGLLIILQPKGTTIEEITSGYDFVEESVNDFSLYRRIQTEESTDSFVGEELPVGTVEYIAVKVVENKDRVAYVGYSVVPGQLNPTEDTVPEILRSFTLL